MKLYLDLETYSETPIKHGTHAYAAKAEILLFAYAFGDDPVIVMECDGEHHIFLQAVLDKARNDNLEIVAHNSHFDRTILNALGFYTTLSDWRDTMVRALSHSLPGGLDKLCEIFAISQDKAKDKDGKKLIQMFCVPQPEGRKHRRLTRETNPVEWARFIEYARLDIEAMRELDKVLPTFNYNEEVGDLQQWFLDQQINDRGFLADVELADAAVRQTLRTQKTLGKKTEGLTYGIVDSATRRDRLLAFILAAYNVDLPDMQRSTIERRIADPDLPFELRQLLATRLQATTTSNAKYKTLLRSVSSDGRLRNSLKFCGASRTGRWSGQLFQPQNLARPDKDMTPERIEAGIEALKADCLDMVEDDPMRFMSNACRGAIIAPPGKKLVISDLKNIEGRAQAWIADEDWKLAAFAAYDKGQAEDLYCQAYGAMFGIKPENVSKDERQVGKVSELALGYAGGVGAFYTFALAYNVDLDEMANKITLPKEFLEPLESTWNWAVKEGRTFGLVRETYKVCDYFKCKWRDAHPHIAALWEELDDLVRAAIRSPETVFVTNNRKIKVVKNKNWLRIILPSGRSLCYPSPKIEEGKISYMGVNQYTRKWQRIFTYGGKLFENICQALSRDIMAANMPMIEKDCYQIVLTVHDEVITEAPDDETYGPKDLSAWLAAVPRWAKGMPLAASGFETKRYRKDVS